MSTHSSKESGSFFSAIGSRSEHENAGANAAAETAVYEFFVNSSTIAAI